MPSDSLQTQFSDYLHQTLGLTSKDRILVAVSAGVDSVVMAHLFRSLQFDIGLAHANYGLRENDSLKDQLFVEDLAKSWKVPFHCRKFDTKSYAQERGISLQMGARDLRYQWFEEIAVEEQYHWIAVGQHQNDVLETMIFNFTKGTGLRGLHGIRPRRGPLIRPLLFSDKEQILTFAQRQGISWRQDQSNSEDYYRRNLIRNKVIPLLKQINPRLEKAAARTAEIMTTMEGILEQHLQRLRSEMVTPKDHHVWVDLEKLREQPLPIWFELLQEFGFNYDQITDMAKVTSTTGARKFMSGDFLLNVDREHIIISPLKSAGKAGFRDFEIADDSSASWSNHRSTWTVEHYSSEGHVLIKDPFVGAWDRGKIKFPLKVRQWRAGDWFCPLGMEHRKKVSDFLIDQKVPANLKHEVQVMVSGEDIIWLIGHRIDHRYRITEQTREILEIKVAPAHS